MSLTTFLVRRLGGVALVTLGITLVTFVTLHLFPADPARLLAGPGADEGQIRAIRQDLGLDRPLPVQYARYLRDLANGNLGRSIQTGQPVADDLVKRLPATLELAAVTMLVYIGLAVPLGILAAVTSSSGSSRSAGWPSRRSGWASSSSSSCTGSSGGSSRPSAASPRASLRRPSSPAFTSWTRRLPATGRFSGARPSS